MVVRKMFREVLKRSWKSCETEVPLIFKEVWVTSNCRRTFWLPSEWAPEFIVSRLYGSFIGLLSQYWESIRQLNFTFYVQVKSSRR